MGKSSLNPLSVFARSNILLDRDTRNRSNIYLLLAFPYTACRENWHVHTLVTVVLRFDVSFSPVYSPSRYGLNDHYDCCLLLLLLFMSFCKCEAIIYGLDFAKLRC